MDEHARGYREPAPPAPERFPLRMGAASRMGLLVSAGTIVLSIVVLLVTGRVFLLLFAGLGPGVFHLLSGAPRMIEVHHDAVVVRSWLRRPTRLPAAELSVQRVDGDLVLVTPDATLAIATEHFPDDSLARCSQALRAIGAKVVGRG